MGFVEQVATEKKTYIELQMFGVCLVWVWNSVHLQI